MFHKKTSKNLHWKLLVTNLVIFDGKNTNDYKVYNYEIDELITLVPIRYRYRISITERARKEIAKGRIIAAASRVVAAKLNMF